MSNNEIVEKALVEVQGFQDLPIPKILANGKELTVFYINVEKIMEDGGMYKKVFLKDGVNGLQHHVLEMHARSEIYASVINEMVIGVEDISGGDNVVIVGGETRDWVVSMPVAQKFGLPHIAISKTGKIEQTLGESLNGNYEGYKAIHFVDMLTAG